MNTVVKLPLPQTSMLEEDVKVDFDETEIQKAAMTTFDEMVDGGCGLRDCITAVYLAGMERVTGAKPAKKTKKEAIPPCPYASIQGLYNERLEDLPRATLMGAERKRGIRKFWMWVFESRKSDGSRRATTSDEALNWIGLYFARAAENGFITGKTKRGAGHEGWEADIDYLVSPRGIKMVVEKTRSESA